MNCNFEIRPDKTYGNKCNKCCWFCKYAFEPPKDSKETWIPCSDFCMRLSEVRKLTCLDCDNKPDYMHRDTTYVFVPKKKDENKEEEKDNNEE